MLNRHHSIRWTTKAKIVQVGDTEMHLFNSYSYIYIGIIESHIYVNKYYNSLKINMLHKINLLDKWSIYFVYFFCLFFMQGCSQKAHNLSTILLTYFILFLLVFWTLSKLKIHLFVIDGKNDLKYLFLFSKFPFIIWCFTWNISFLGLLQLIKKLCVIRFNLMS